MKKTLLILIMVLAILLPFGVQSPIATVYASDDNTAIIKYVMSGTPVEIENETYFINSDWLTPVFLPDYDTQNKFDALEDELITNTYDTVTISFETNSGVNSVEYRVQNGNVVERPQLAPWYINGSSYDLFEFIFNFPKFSVIKITKSIFLDYQDFQNNDTILSNVLFSKSDSSETYLIEDLEVYHFYLNDSLTSYVFNLLPQNPSIKLFNNGQFLTYVQVPNGTWVALPENTPEKNNLDFLYWKSSEGQVLNPQDSFIATYDMNLTAIYEGDNSPDDYINPPTVNEYVLTFETNGGEVINAFEVYENSVLNLPTPTRQGYNFEGWYSDANLTISFTATTMPSNDLTLYAKWNINTYTINFITNGGSELQSLQLDYNSTITIPTPMRTGYEFNGWYIDLELTTNFTATIMPANDLTLYAAWQEVQPTDPGTEEPTDPNEEDPNEEDPTPGTEDPNEDIEPSNGDGWFDWLQGPWDWFKGAASDIGSAIGGVAKAVWESDIGKIAVITVGGIIIIGGIAAIVGAAMGATGLFAAVGVGLKATLLPLLKIMFTSKAALFIWTPVLAAGGFYIAAKLFWPEAAEAVEKGLEMVKEGLEFLDKNVVDPLAKATGLPKILVWPMVIALIPLAVILIYDVIKTLIKGLFRLGKRKEKTKSKPKPKSKPKTRR